MLRGLVAALSLFTRLPFWRLIPDLKKEDYQEAMSWWAVVGLLTGSVLAFTFYFSASFFSPMIAILLALALRMLMTGAFHEDGLGDFFDGFGAGGGKERILTIMKDSHIGAYAVLAYIIYFFLFTHTLSDISTRYFEIYDEYVRVVACYNMYSLLIPVIIFGDVFSKFVASLQVYFLPYARDEETSKLKFIYTKPAYLPLCLSLILILSLFIYAFSWHFLPYLLLPLMVAFGLMYYIKGKIGGYTGDTCGAIFMMTELIYYLTFLLYLNTQPERLFDLA